MSFFSRKKDKIEDLQRIVDEGSAIREMMQHRGGRIIEDYLAAEKEWVAQEWMRHLDVPGENLESSQHELRAYLKALVLVEFLFLGKPKSAWKAEDRLLAFSGREHVYSTNPN